MLKQPIHYLETGSTTPAYNLAFEEYLLTSKTEGTYLILWQNEDAVIIGRNQIADAEINTDYITRNKIHVVRRSTGGGAVYHDLGNLNFSIITDITEPEETSLLGYSRLITTFLNKMGIPAVCAGKNDILVDGKKISGAAQRIEKGRLLHHGTLLFDTDLERMRQALHSDPEKFEGKGVSSIRARVGNIRAYLADSHTLEDIKHFLLHDLCGDDVKKETLSPIDINAIRQLKETKYDTWAWNFGESPNYQYKNKKRYTGGTLHIHADVNKGVIAAARIYGDFMATADLAPLCDRLQGLPYEKVAVANALYDVSLSPYLGTISLEEFLQTLFGG